MDHPFLHLSPTQFRRGFAASVVATLVVMVGLVAMATGFSAKEDAAGKRYDMVQFELAYIPALSAHIAETWGPEGRAMAWWQTVLDFVFLVAYSNAIAFGVLFVAERGFMRRWFLGFAVFLAYGQWFSALCDVIENLCLLRILSAGAVSPLPELAAICAGPKFAFVLAGLLFFVAGLPSRFLFRK
jgi:hypothetical protein